jgi:hypothetical protein
MTPDLDLMLFDFAQEYQAAPQQALARMQLLLLDEEACSGRIAYLEALAEKAPTEAANRGVADFEPEITLLCETGLYRAHQDGSLRPERLALLTRSPAALRAAHRRLVALSEEPPSGAASLEPQGLAPLLETLPDRR